MAKEDMAKSNSTEKTTTSRRAELIKVINNSALIEQEPSIKGLHTNLDSRSGGGIYYGTGLTTPRAIGVGLPFDVLGMILTAEELRRAGKFSSIYHHIADTHAKTNDWIDPEQVDRRAGEVRQTLEKLAGNLKLEGFYVTLSSDFDMSKEYREILSSFDESPEHEYVRREMADMEWYRQRHGVELKLGWIIQAKETGLGFDERLFDREYLRLRGEQLSFVYAKAGRTFDKGRPKASPYIQIEGERRIVIDSKEDVEAKIAEAVSASGDPTLGGATKHLQSIVRSYEKLYGNLGDLTLNQKIQVIIDQVTK